MESIVGEGSTTSGESLMYSKLHGCGWRRAAISVPAVDRRGAVVHLQLKAGHILRVQYDSGAMTWQPFGLWLLGDSTNNCDLPPAMRTVNVSRSQAEVAAQSIQDIPLLAAFIAQRLRTVPLANARETVEEIAQLSTWTRERLFMAAAWLMANGWPTADASIGVLTDDDYLRKLIKFALSVNAENYQVRLGLAIRDN